MKGLLEQSDSLLYDKPLLYLTISVDVEEIVCFHYANSCALKLIPQGVTYIPYKAYVTKIKKYYKYRAVAPLLSFSLFTFSVKRLFLRRPQPLFTRFTCFIRHFPPHST